MDDESDSDTIEVGEVETLAKMLTLLAESYEVLSRHLRNDGIEKIPGRGASTARRGAEYLANFTSTLMKAYQAQIADGGQEMPPESEAKLLRGGALARSVSKKGGGKKLGTNGGTRKS